MTRDQRERLRRDRLRHVADIEREIDRAHTEEEQRAAAAALGVLHHLPPSQSDLELPLPA